MRLRFHVAVFTACLSMAAQGRGSVSDLVAQVRAELQRSHSDSRVAKDLRKVRLNASCPTSGDVRHVGHTRRSLDSQSDVRLIQEFR